MPIQVKKMARSLMPLLDDASPYLDAAACLEEAGQILIAGAVLDEAERQHPMHETVFMRRTEFIERHHGPQAALARWVLMANRFPGQERAWAKLVRQHRGAGRLQTAESVLAEGIAKAGQSKLLFAEGALVAQARGDLDEAAHRWRAGIEHYPRWPEATLAHNVIQSMLAARGLDMALAQGAQAPDTDHLYLPAGEPDADRLRALFMRFESLGNDSQFGVVQRYFGAGTLGLFRYAGINANDLVRALNNDLSEIFEASDVTLMSQPSDWYVRVPRAGLQMRTLVESADPEAFLVQMRRRLRHLAMTLLEDLRDGQKAFVFKAHDLLEDQISALHAAVRRHGPAVLLCVRRAGEGHPPGSVEARDDGLWVGSIPPSGLPDKAFRDAWVAICKAVAEAAPAGH